MSVRVFTVNNHYLSHLSLLIKEMGPLRAYSCRAMERTINKYTNLIKSPTKIGVNASNVLRHQANMNKTAVRRLMAEHFSRRSDPEDIFETSHDDSLQVWGRAKTVDLTDLDNQDEICGGTTRQKLFKGLKSYYTRLTGSTC